MQSCRPFAAILFFIIVGLVDGPTLRGKELGTREQPNIIIVMADDLGYRDISCYGCVDFQSPNIDSLARGGIRCTNGYVSHPYCSPSRAGLLSGKYQQSFGHEHNPPYDEENEVVGIDEATRLLPSLLEENGYRTGLIGKWHLGAGEPFRPARRGITEFYGFLGGGHDYFKTDPKGKNYRSPMWRNHHPTDDTLTYLTDDLTEEALRFIDRNQTRPFCLLLMYNAPHAPDQVTEEYMQRVASIPHPARRRYAALVQGVDEGVGRISSKLDSLQLNRKTLFVFLSDNGGRRGVSDNRPLRGNKGWLHEGGIRVPFILSMPGRLPRNQVYDQPLIALDLLPTAIRMAGIEIPDGCDGVDLTPFLTGADSAAPHKSLFWRVSGGEGYAVRQGNWKLVRDIGMDQPELYDLSKDIGEDHDVAQSEPGILSTLQAKFDDWARTLETPRWTEGHTQNTLSERAAAAKAGTRQFPMNWPTPSTKNPTN